MGETRTQSKWDCTEKGILTNTLPSGLTVSFDLTLIYPMWDQFDEAQKFYAAYGVKQKLSDKCAATKDASYTDEEKIERMTELYDFTCAERKLPEVKKAGGFGVSKKVATEIKSGVEAIMEKFNVPEEAAKAIQEELDKLKV